MKPKFTITSREFAGWVIVALALGIIGSSIGPEVLASIAVGLLTSMVLMAIYTILKNTEKKND